MEIKKENGIKIKYVLPLLWISLILFLIIQYRYVYLYYDDFGYYSLSYGYNAGINGTDMSFRDIIRYLYHSYFMVNGRVSTTFLFVVMAWLGGVEAMRIALPLCILFIYLIMYDLTKKTEMKSGTKILVTTFLCFSYGIFNISICHYGFYWFIAAFNYVFPMLFFLMFCHVYRNKSKILPAIAFFLCLFSEQMLAMVLVFIMYNCIIDLYDRKKLDVIYIITAISAILSSVLMISSPASRGRMISEGNREFYNRPFLDKVFYNSERIVNLFFNETGVLFVLMLLLFFLFVSVQLIINKDRFRVIHILWGGFTSLLIFIFCCDKISYAINFDGKTHLLFLYFIFSFGEIFIFYYKNDQSKASWVVATAASMGVLLLVPEIPIRTFIPFMFMCILFSADIITRVKRRDTFVLICAIMIPYMFLSISNLSSIYSGYKKNSIILDYNNSKLIEARDKLDNGETVTVVELYKMIDDVYTGQQAYDLNISYMKFWMDAYYSLPFEVEYVYYDYPTKDNPVSICHVN